LSTALRGQYSRWVHNQYKQIICRLACQCIAKEEELQRERNERAREENERIQRAQGEKEERARKHEEWLRESRIRGQKSAWEGYCARRNGYSAKKEAHNLNMLSLEILDTIYFIQNNAWAMVWNKGNKSYKTRRTPEQIKNDSQFKEPEPEAPRFDNEGRRNYSSRRSYVYLERLNLFQANYSCSRTEHKVAESRTAPS
jgi:hypothetical protein